MSTTPIFDQLCQELGDVIEVDVLAQEINLDVDATAASESKPAVDSEKEETMAEWSAPEARRVTVPRLNDFPADHNEY